MHVGWIRAGLGPALAAFVGSFAVGAAAAPETTTYRYDALGRLVSTSGEGGETALRYDPAGNRTQYVVAGTGGMPGILVAGSFESGALPEAGYEYGPHITGATFENAAGITLAGGAWGFQPTGSGNQLAFLQSGPQPAAITLAVTGLTPGAAYRVAFRIGRRGSYPPVPLTVAYRNSAAGSPAVALGTYAPASPAFAGATTPIFVAAGTDGFVTFTGIAASGDMATGLDAVTVVPLSLPPPAVANASFEIPAASDYLYRPTASFLNGAGVARAMGAWGFAAAPDGAQAAFLQGSGASVSLALSGLAAGGAYRVRFRIAARAGNQGVTLDLAYKDSGAAQGVALGPFAPSGPAFAEKLSASFVAAGATGVLSFTARPIDGDQTSFLDLVAVEPVP
jgi:YD repeat-containing protein